MMVFVLDSKSRISGYAGLTDKLRERQVTIGAGILFEHLAACRRPRSKWDLQVLVPAPADRESEEYELDIHEVGGLTGQSHAFEK